MNFQKNFFYLSTVIFILVSISAIILSVSRVLFLFNHVDASLLDGREDDLLRALFVGLRFDLKITTIGFAPLYLCGIMLSAFPRLFKKASGIFPGYATIIFFLLIAFSIGNYYYYVTFGNHFDVFIFGLVDDDTTAVLVNAWEDYPIIISSLAAITLTLAWNKTLKHALSRLDKLSFKSFHWSIATIIVISFIGIYAALARGSISTLPLKRYHANVSDYPILNKATPNAFMALDWARSDYKKQTRFKPVSEKTVTAQMQKVLGQPTPEYNTPENNYLSANKPHVVMTLMEGFATNVLVEDIPEKNDLLGALRKPFKEDFVFKRFLAGTTATIDSMVMMLFHSGNPSISHSNVQKIHLPDSAIQPYKKAGYEIVYITAGNAMWRNLANYLPLQGFDTIADENTLIKAFPEAKKYADTWGVPDEYAFKYAEKLLQESDKPLMIYILTVTNHSPFRAPEHYQSKPIKVSERLYTLLGPLQEQAKALLGAYQYANDAFGQFIERVKQSSLAEKTLIAGSGDHRMRYLDIKEKSEYAISFAVPFYLYVPQTILKHVPHNYDNQRIGSHKDIFPTLYHFSLSDSTYTSLGGENLLTEGDIRNFAYNSVRSANQEGAYSTNNPWQLYPWARDKLHTLEEPVTITEPVLGQEYRKLQNYYLRWRVTRTE